VRPVQLRLVLVQLHQAVDDQQLLLLPERLYG
jgi:hypothetical protein